MAEKLVYLITGDPFLRKAEQEALVSKLQTGGNTEIQSFDVIETPLAQILSAARTLPFLVDKQILRIKQCDKLKEDAAEELEAYLKNPFDKSYLIFESDKTDERGKFFKLIQERGTVIKPAAADMMKREVQLIRSKLGEAKKTITPEAQKRLLEACGESPIFLATMLDRLILFAGDKAQIDETMTGQFQENWSEARIFDLSDAILARDPSKAVDVLRKLLEIEGDVYALVGFIHFQIKKLWQAKILAGEGASQQQIAARLGMKSAFASANFFRGLERFELARLEKAIDDLHKLDWKAKTGRAEMQSGLETWLIQLTAAGNGSRK